MPGSQDALWVPCSAHAAARAADSCEGPLAPGTCKACAPQGLHGFSLGSFKCCVWVPSSSPAAFRAPGIGVPSQLKEGSQSGSQAKLSLPG